MARKTDKPLLLIDGSSYFYRAYHAIRDLTSPSGMSTNAVFGVVRMLRKELEDYQPERVAVVFDAKGKTFRDKMYKEYKANRPPMPDDLREQVEPLRAIVQAMGLPLLVVPGVEADDVIGTLAREAVKEKIPVIISTGDKDLAQLVNKDVTLINTMSNTSMDIDGVEDKFGIGPELIIDYLALIGDTSDNVPGIPKVGPKTAVKWLKEFGDLDSIVANADAIKGKVGENLRDNLEQLELSRKLVTIKCDVELDVHVRDLKREKPDNETLKHWYSELGFRSLLEEVIGGGEAATGKGKSGRSKKKPVYTTVLDNKTLDGWISKLEKAKCFAFDTETTSLDYMQAELVGLSFSVKPGEAAYVPVMHDYPGAPEQLERDQVLAKLKPLLESSKPKLVGQHIKYDMNVLARYGIGINCVQQDTMLESYVLDSNERHDLDSLALKYLGVKTVHFEDIAGKGAKQLTFNQIDLDTASAYAAEDADITLGLHEVLGGDLDKHDRLKSVYRDIEIPLIYVLSRMERQGVLVDAKMLAKQSGELGKKIEDLEKRAYKLAGGEFNLGSPKQIQEILFEKQGLPVIKKTPKGQPSTAEEVLQELSLDYPLPKLILEHRSFSKLRSTYVDRLPEQIDPDSGRVHTSYHQAVAATGRLSSSDPNLQNIPVRTEEGRRIRQAFVAEKGYSIVAADYSQIELRIMAHLSGDKRLLEAFRAGEDIHRATAAEVFGVAVDKVDKEQRRSAKAINFGLIYGMSAFGLARQLGIERGEAQNYVDLYFERYPGVKAYMDNIRQAAHDRGYVETVFGRRLILPEINSKNAMRRQYAERTAINAPMQGTAADIIKRAMITVDNWVQQQADRVRMIMQVHDELVFEIRKEFVEEASQQISVMMQGAADLDVELIVDTGIGRNWDEAH